MKQAGAILTNGTGIELQCNCGWKTPRRATFEAAGRDLDLHLAERFPIGTQRIMSNCTGERQ